MNYFDSIIAAQRYSKGRPHSHATAIEHIRHFLQLQQKLNMALDIACGTGLSTYSLLDIAANVYGTDPSIEMLRLATTGSNIHFKVAPAERQPFADSTFDLITVSSGIHWFDIDQFLTEANRLLKAKAWLVLYENYSIAEIPGHESFTGWIADVYSKKYPPPPRNNFYDWSNNILNPKNLNLVKEDTFKTFVTFNKKQLILFFTSHSNIISAIEKNETSYKEVETWLNSELTPFFNDNETARTINFMNWIKFIQRLD